MNINGIDFMASDNCKNPMKIIMEDIDTSNYKYSVQWCEIYNKGLYQEDGGQEIFKIFDENIDYIKILKDMEEYYCIFFEAFLFVKNPVWVYKKEEYISNQDLKLAFYNYDTDYFRIFSKDIEMLNLIYNNVKNSEEFYDLKYIESI